MQIDIFLFVWLLLYANRYILCNFVKITANAYSLTFRSIFKTKA